MAMTPQEAAHQLEHVRQYCSARSLVALDYAIQVLQEKAAQEAKQATAQEAKK